MNNLRHQTGDLFFKGRDFLHIATGLASLFNGHLCLALSQRWASFKVGYPGRVLRALTASTSSRRNLRIEPMGRRRNRTMSQRIMKKGKEKKIQRGNIRLHTKRIYKEYNPMAKVLGLHLTKVFTSKRRKLKKIQRS
jgi:hypothetical protein